ncbi:MAG: adenylosuccinate lyase [Lentisphaeria bacterium]|jgi:adenylosuccinate lyase
MDDRAIYENPLAQRYASKEMNRLWSPRTKFSTWRKLWVALAKAERQLGLPITAAQVASLEAHLTDINFAAAEAWEKKLRHDVMSHIQAYGEQCPEAKPIIHLGATSCYVTDNTELIQMREGLRLLTGKLAAVIRSLAAFARQWRGLPTLGFTHFQPAQLTTVGKRACLWLYDFTLDFATLERLAEELPFRGVKGTTGTQASFLELFAGDHAKVRELDRLVTAAMGFKAAVPVAGQTYSRKHDFAVLAALSALAQSAAKMATDLRLLAHLKEIEEPFETGQVGSSAMAYKRNPMRCERICALARYVMSLEANAAQTQANQWFERTLDDSANRRLSLPQAFLAADIILSTAANVASGLQVWPKVIGRHVQAELPFMATEAVIMAGVKAGGDRQELHEAIRTHSMAAGRRVKEEGADNDLLDRLAADPLFAAIRHELPTLTDPRRFTGRAPEQVAEFLAEVVEPLLARAAATTAATATPDEVQL